MNPKVIKVNLFCFCVFGSEMEIDTQENILVTKFMDLGSTTLPMDIVMKGLGMKAESKALVCTLLEMATLDVVNGMVALLSTLYHH